MRKKVSSWTLLGCFVFSLVVGVGNIAVVQAATVGSVVINEVAWAGSADSSADEWIELYNTTGAVIDLTGWTIDDDNGASIYSLSGSIGANGYYLIEDSELAVNPNTADLLVNLSLANTGDSLVLYDNGALLIDSVNTSGGAWFAGASASFASMERIDALASGDNAGNWGNSDGSGSSATASLGALIVGTPGMTNSVSVPVVVNPGVSFQLSTATPDVGGQITVDVNVSDAASLFSYGMDITYDPAVLNFVSVTQGTFLSESLTVATSFQSGLEDGTEGRLLVAEARMLDVKSGVSGNGTLFSMTFDVVGGAGVASDLVFDAASFFSDMSGEVTVDYTNSQFTPQSVAVGPVTNLQTIEASQRYSIQLSWNPVVGATSYKVFRQDVHGVFIQLDEISATLFVDLDAVVGGGDIVPNHNYSYRVIAVNGAVESTPMDVSGIDTRGLKGDNDRSDRVDGRDLDNLARHFAETDLDVSFDPLVDTTYDGNIDGSDLIDLGASFALTYQL